MYNPKDVLTKSGLEEHRVHIFNMKKAIFWLTNNADDLHIGMRHKGDKALDVIYNMKGLLDSELLQKGDGEEIEE